MKTNYFNEVEEGRLTIPVNPQRDHLQGRVNAPVTLVEYGDYECPFCGAAHRVIKELQEAMGDELCFAFRNFPLTNVHPHAQQAAEAAEAAAEQDRFWEMHDLLYENQEALEDEDILEYAGAAGLDVRRFLATLQSGMPARRVREDFMSGIRSGVNGTPTFFINDARYQGSYDFESMMEVLEEAKAVARGHHAHRH